VKNRNSPIGHVLIDTERGGNSSLDSSNNGPAQIDLPVPPVSQLITAFNLHTSHGHSERLGSSSTL
jgi:hypothetical protein